MWFLRLHNQPGREGSIEAQGDESWLTRTLSTGGRLVPGLLIVVAMAGRESGRPETMRHEIWLALTAALDTRETDDQTESIDSKEMR